MAVSLSSWEKGWYCSPSVILSIKLYGAYKVFIVFYHLLVQMKLFPGRKLDFECKNCERKRSEREFMTLVEFSVEHPYGKALALLDLKSGLVKVCHYAGKSLAENPSLVHFLFI